MKAELKKDGTLVVTPESELEEFALTAWKAGWNGGCQIDATAFQLRLTSDSVLAERSKE